ncbi:hypothetical protein Dform_01019 [Dehalogenimonas formicexedens]|uniref:Uncharacterized protein n=1 Tax=Dehalogenimonas formicexedens TaxID=1839801 RepID=A0A1P8F7E9_9CHLR|nr:hypothetical protein [Dehalogenimonas formicexedens]APV44355.1 hypothetical protein Dform_01019 [Dehalogenimonas formicexedens]
MADTSIRREQIKVAAAQYPESIEKGISQLIGGLLVFGLALGGLAIGYSTTITQWAATSVLVVTGFLLTVSALWSLIRKQ